MVDHYVEEAQRYHSLAMRQRLEIAYTREENQRLKVRVGVLGDQLSSALEGALESWDDVERVQQEACGFALGAGMEVAFWKDAAETVGLSYWAAVERIDAALARAEAAEVELFEARAERDGLRAALQGHLDLAYRAERLEKALLAIEPYLPSLDEGPVRFSDHAQAAGLVRAALREGKPFRLADAARGHSVLLGSPLKDDKP